MANPKAAIADGAHLRDDGDAGADHGGRRCRAPRWSFPTKATSASARSPPTTRPRSRRSTSSTTRVRYRVGDGPRRRRDTIITVGQDFVRDGDPVGRGSPRPTRRSKPGAPRDEAHRRLRGFACPADAGDPDLHAARRRVRVRQHPQGIDARTSTSPTSTSSPRSAAFRRRTPSACCSSRWRRRSSRSTTSRR